MATPDDDECPGEEVSGTRSPTVLVRVRPSTPSAPTPSPTPLPVPVPAPGPGAEPTLSSAIVSRLDRLLLRGVFRRPFFTHTRAATRVILKQYTLRDPTQFTPIIRIPDDALSWELWNSNLGPNGTLSWAYVSNPGATGEGEFNQLANLDRAVRALAGVTLYVQPQLANQICVVEVLLP